MTGSVGRWSPAFERVADTDTPLWLRALGWARWLVLMGGIGWVIAAKHSWYWISLPIAVFAALNWLVMVAWYRSFLSIAESHGISRREAKAHLDAHQYEEGDLITLYRPVGKAELDLIESSGWTRFPPRLPEQPIFYPVTNEEYARQIARDWNARHNEDRRGYVTQFNIDAMYLSQYAPQIVGSGVHEEYWIPAEDLPAFNAAIDGPIKVIATFEGEAV